jgi:hypothetical protein
MYKLPDAPLPPGGILDDGFMLFRSSWRPLLPIAIVMSLCSAVPQAMMADAWATMTEGLRKAAIEGRWEIQPGEILSLPDITPAAKWTIVVCTLLSIIAYTTLIAGIDRAARSGNVTTRAALRTGLERAPATLGALILSAVMICVGFMLFVIPGLYLGVALFPALLVPVVERRGPYASVVRALRLASGSWWRIAVVLSVLMLVTIALLSVIQVAIESVVASIAGAVGGGGRATAVTVLLASLVTAPLTPLVYCLMYALYTDLRLRKDGGAVVSEARAA